MTSEAKHEILVLFTEYCLDLSFFSGDRFVQIYSKLKCSYILKDLAI